MSWTDSQARSRRAPRRARRAAFGAALVAALAPALAAAAAPAQADAAITPASRAGALFTPLSFGFHECSGVVIHSKRRDLFATAAHCFVGTGAGFTFSPGYANGPATGTSTLAQGHAPYGGWKVRAVWVDPHWKPHGNPAYDLAIAAVEPQKRNGKLVQLEDIVPGAVLAHSAPAAGTAIEAVGYPAGKGGTPVDCRATTTLTGSAPTFACPNFIGGTSGGPWLTTAANGTLGVAGVIGGLHQGGCTSDVSYAAPLGAWSDALLARAERRSARDLLPLPPGDGC